MELSNVILLEIHVDELLTLAAATKVPTAIRTMTIDLVGWKILHAVFTSRHTFWHLRYNKTLSERERNGISNTVLIFMREADMNLINIVFLDEFHILSLPLQWWSPYRYYSPYHWHISTDTFWSIQAIDSLLLLLSPLSKPISMLNIVFFDLGSSFWTLAVRDPCWGLVLRTGDYNLCLEFA